MISGSVLAEAKADAYEPLGAFGQPVYQSVLQLRAAVAGRLGDRYANLFAEPQFDHHANTIRWISTVPGDAVAWSDLSPADQADRALDLQIMRGDFKTFIGELQGHGAQAGAGDTRGAEAFVSVLEQSLKTPNDKHLYFVGDQPVITFWGFREEALQPFDPLSVAPPAPSVAAPAAAAAVATAPARRRMPWWMLLGGLLLLLLLGLLLWWLFADDRFNQPNFFDTPLAPNERLDVPEPRAEEPLRVTPEELDRPGVVVRPDGRYLLPDGRVVAPDGTVLETPDGVVGQESPAPDGTVVETPGVPDGEVPAPPKPDVPEGENPAGQNPPQPEVPEQNAPEQNAPEPEAPEQNGQDESKPEENAPDPAETQPPTVPEPPKPDVGGDEAQTQDDQQQPSGPSLDIPADAPKDGAAGFVRGQWKSDSGLVDGKTGKKLKQQYNFDKSGKGETVIRRADGSKCRAPAQATMQGGELVIRELADPTCPDGQRYKKSVTRCKPDPSGKTKCQGAYDRGGNYSVNMNRP